MILNEGKSNTSFQRRNQNPLPPALQARKVMQDTPEDEMVLLKEMKSSYNGISWHIPETWKM